MISRAAPSLTLRLAVGAALSLAGATLARADERRVRRFLNVAISPDGRTLSFTRRSPGSHSYRAGFIRKTSRAHD